MSVINEKLRATLEEFLDSESAETVDATIVFLRRLGSADRMFAAEWLVQVEAERKEEAARVELEAAGA